MRTQKQSIRNLHQLLQCPTLQLGPESDLIVATCSLVATFSYVVVSLATDEAVAEALAVPYIVLMIAMYFVHQRLKRRRYD
jgi:hypothetical protein